MKKKVHLWKRQLQHNLLIFFFHNRQIVHYLSVATGGTPSVATCLLHTDKISSELYTCTYLSLLKKALNNKYIYVGTRLKFTFLFWISYKVQTRKLQKEKVSMLHVYIVSYW